MQALILIPLIKAQSYVKITCENTTNTDHNGILKIWKRDLIPTASSMDYQKDTTGTWLHNFQPVVQG